MESITYRWLDAEGTDSAASAEDWARIDAILEARGWMSLPKKKWGVRALIAEDAQGSLVGFLLQQYIPYVGPLFVVPSRRGQGVAEQMSVKMFQFLGEAHARGWIANAESPHAAQLMEQFGMVRVETPVYVLPYPGGISAP